LFDRWKSSPIARGTFDFWNGRGRVNLLHKLLLRNELDDGVTLCFRRALNLSHVGVMDRAWSLSGGEQQMLALGRALMGRPRLLMLDEPSLGRAPIAIEQVFNKILELNKRTGLAVLVEQNSAMALEVAARAFVLETGEITLSGPSAALADDPRIREAYLRGWQLPLFSENHFFTNRSHTDRGLRIMLNVKKPSPMPQPGGGFLFDVVFLLPRRNNSNVP
jgi:ABC-type antimicrobial peptide transport system ATPase subunit